MKAETFNNSRDGGEALATLIPLRALVQTASMRRAVQLHTHTHTAHSLLRQIRLD